MSFKTPNAAEECRDWTETLSNTTYAVPRPTSLVILNFDVDWILTPDIMLTMRFLVMNMIYKFHHNSNDCNNNVAT